MTMYDLLNENIKKNGKLTFLVREQVNYEDLPKYKFTSN